MEIAPRLWLPVLMEKILSVVVPDSARPRPSIFSVPYIARMADAETLVVIRQVDEDAIAIDLRDNSVREIFRFHADASNPHRTIGELRLATVDEKHIAVFEPAGRTLTIRTLDGNKIRGIEIPFELEDFLPLGTDGFVALGEYRGDLLHILDSSGNILRSSFPTIERIYNDGSLKATYGRLCAGDGESLYVLCEHGAGIIDHRDLPSLGLRTRFVANPRRKPMMQRTSFTFSGYAQGIPIPKAHGSCPLPDLPILDLSFPTFLPPLVRSIANASNGRVAVLDGSGKFMMLLDSSLRPQNFFALPTLFTDPVPYRPMVFAVMQARASWIACDFQGGIWRLEESDLRRTTGQAFVGELQDFQTGHPFFPFGTVPMIPSRDLEHHADFWRSVGCGSYEFSLKLDSEGRVLAGKLAKPPIFGAANSPPTAERILDHLRTLRYTPRMARGKWVETDLCVTVMIDPFSTRLMSEAGSIMTTVCI